jgi:hypothetical protein
LTWHGLDAERPDFTADFLRIVFGDIRYRSLRAFARQGKGDRAADAAASSRYQSRFSL